MEIDTSSLYVRQGNVIFLDPEYVTRFTGTEQGSFCWRYPQSVPLRRFRDSCFRVDSLDIVLEADFAQAYYDAGKSMHVPIMLHYEADSASLPLVREGGRVSTLYYSLRPKISRPSLREGASLPPYTSLMMEGRAAIDYFLGLGFQEVRLWESFHRRDPKHTLRKLRMCKTKEQEFDPRAQPFAAWM